jgi:hypothetical protein
MFIIFIVLILSSISPCTIRTVAGVTLVATPEAEAQFKSRLWRPAILIEFFS